jgi:hypothetical protein
MRKFSDAEPSSFEEADKLQVWKDAMLEEYRSNIKNNVWDIVSRPKDKSMVSSKWIYKIKHAANGSVEKFKERFVSKGFTQKEGIDYEEIFSPVARYTSIQTIIALAPVLGWKLHQMDVKTTFLNGNIEHEVFVEQIDGFVLHNKGTHVCKPRNALYDLKQAPRVWYDRIDGFLKSLGFQKSDVDANLYFKVRVNQPVILIMYVDDLFLTRDEGLIAWCNDPGDQILLKIQSARNRFKLNGSVGLVVTKPTQLVWVQTDVGSERYHVLFKMTNRQKKWMLTVQSIRMLTWQIIRHVAGRMTRGMQLCGQLAYDMACLQQTGWRHVAQSMVAMCHIYICLKFVYSAGLDPATSGQGKRVGKGR